MSWKVSAAGVWRLMGWLGLCVLGAYVFRYLLLFVIGLCALVVCWFVYSVVGARLKSDEINSLTAADKKAHYTDSLHFYSILPASFVTSFPRPIGAPKGLASRLSHHLQFGDPYRYETAGLVVHSGLPDISATYDGPLTLHVHSAWSGLFPQSVGLNHFIHTQMGFTNCFQSSLDRAKALNTDHPFVSFYMPTGEVFNLNFGQKDDALVLSHAYDTIAKRFPKARIVVYADCLGGLRLMNWLGPDLPNLAGIVLESPLLSVEHMLSLTKSKRANRWLYRMFCLLVPNFNAELDRYSRYELKPAQQFPDVPVLVAVGQNHWMSGPTHLPSWTSRFPNSQTVVVEEKVKCGELHLAHSFQHETAQFYRTLNKTPNLTAK